MLLNKALAFVCSAVNAIKDKPTHLKWKIGEDMLKAYKCVPYNIYTVHWYAVLCGQDNGAAAGSEEHCEANASRSHNFF